MNKEELKQVLKPLIKECIKEVIFEEGALSSVVSEVVKGMGQQLIVESAPVEKTNKPQYETDEQANARLKAKRKKMMEAIGASSYNGVDLFEGTTPASAPVSEGQSQGPLSGVNPKDPGVDISAIMGKSSAIWSKMTEK
tara:strand:+ start:214 stop:630 length:417 start_codon:yes stop_codon:yes gene_type:complete